MLEGFFEKILSLSGRYNHYKSECSRLNERCKVLEEDNITLRDDVVKLLVKLCDRQDELYKLLCDSSLAEDTDKILDALFGSQEHFTKRFDENRALLESLDDACMRVEKSSSYTNVKLDSKFDENRRFLLDEVVGRLK